MTTDTIPFTQEGYDGLQAELNKLKLERPKVIQEIADARLHGDLSENAEYHAARERQGYVEGRIAELEDKLSRAKIVSYEDSEKPDQVRFGAFVTLTDEESGDAKTYRIVGDLEADIRQHKISLSSPIAKALLGKRVDDLVEVQVPKGVVEYTITEVRY